MLRRIRDILENHIYVTTSIVGVLVAVLLAFIFRVEIAMSLWEKFEVPVPISFLTEVEHASIAYEIGGSYFIGADEGEYDLTRASAYYRHTLQLNPKFMHAWMKLGRIDFLNGNFLAAVSKFNQLNVDEDTIDLRDFSGFFYWRGLVNGYLGRFEEAEHDFQKAIESNLLEGDTAAWASYVDLAWVYFQEGKFEEIIGIMEIAYEENPTNPWVLTMYGTALLNLDRVEEARAILKEAVVEAEKLAPIDWANAYPGNDPLEAPAGRAHLLEAIRFNYNLAEERAVNK